MEHYDSGYFQCSNCEMLDYMIGPYRILHAGDMWCEKIGCKLYYGYCSDAFADDDNCECRSKPRRSEQKSRGYLYRQKTKRAEFERIKTVGNSFYTDRNINTDVNGNEYVSPLSHTRHKTYAKRQSSKKIRRSDIDFVGKGNLAHKIYDYWYTVW